MPDPRSLLARLQRRKLGQWLLGYLAGSWLVLQALDIFIQNFDLSHTLFRIILTALVAGICVVAVLAWYHGERGAQRVTRLELVLLTAIVVLGGISVGFVAARRGTPRRADSAAPAEEVDRASVAVLPFQDLSPKHDQDYFSDGLTEELLNVIARIPGLRVAARTSSFAFKGRNVDVDSIGRALRVAHVLEGSVRTEAGRVRINAELIDAHSGFQVWNDSYDRDLKDVFALQAEIANAIAPQLRLRLGKAAAAAIAGGAAAAATVDPQAHALFLRGVHFARLNSRRDLAQATRLLQQALERDPRYARAYAELGAAYHRQAYLRYLPSDSGYRLAEGAARKALELDAADFRAHEVLGRIADYRRWDFRTAEREFGLALQSNPSDAITHSHRAWMLMRLRRTAEALAEAERACALDPISGGMTSNLAAMYLYAGQTALAARTFEAAVALEPTDYGSLANLATAYAIAGRHADAVRSIEQAMAHTPDDDFISATGAFVYARAGRSTDARRLLEQLEAKRDISPYLLATIHGALGDRERALELLDRAVQRHDDFAGDVAVDPALEPLRAEPRFNDILRRGGLL